jgi:hypothetical protein
MDANSEIRIGIVFASLEGSRYPSARFALAARPLGCEGLEWRFWGWKVVSHASRPLRAGVRTRAPTPWLPAPFRGLRARGHGLPGTGAGTEGRGVHDKDATRIAKFRRFRNP